MSELDDLEFDPHELAEELGYTDELGMHDMSDMTIERATTKSQRMSRRDLMVKGGIGAAALTGLGSVAGRASAATERADAFTGTLRVITLGVEWPQGAEQQAEKDLGFRFNVQPMSTNAQVQKSITAPTSFDIGGLYNYQFFQIWPTGNFQPVDRRRVQGWNGFYPIFTKGKVQPGRRDCTPGQGNAPYRVTFVDPNGSTGLPRTKEGPRNNRQIVQWWNDQTNRAYGGRPQPTNVLGPPAHFNMDSMGYNGDVIRKQPGQVHWAELLNNRHRGRVAVLNDPGIAMADLGNAVQSLGMMKFKNLGNMTRGEMDRLFAILGRYKRNGHFRAFWSTFNESVNLMASKEVVIESMWSPAVALLVAQGVNCRYAFPKEGMRGWCSATGIPKHVTGEKLDAAYRYINWMYEGFLGALIMRQGYYIANGRSLPRWLASDRARSTARPPFTADEYQFWYNGRPAARDLPGITGRVGDIKKGQTRDGGSFIRRSCKYTAWNSFYTENVYQVRKFNEFLSS
jgi:putative spermidine/putrescine transport system substrate-binding protein